MKPRPGRLKFRLRCHEFSRVQRLLVVTIRIRGSRLRFFLRRPVPGE
ncbi:hypothetical protein L915_15574 [Phytophthora nicotianae]|uniref:Uncharacterized protein n=1 Tax=Phytophthora nicotianae TaxID=4792 RepID=W2IC29_PHYNI|nr:hypothetical protein L915_15574 [Phytophthora nicotianae]ETL31809.1 hypothetical protein L916_15471 [Phytophthora nicotianae]